jgi:hypothetical protein
MHIACIECVIESCLFFYACVALCNTCRILYGNVIGCMVVTLHICIIVVDVFIFID